MSEHDPLFNAADSHTTTPTVDKTNGYSACSQHIDDDVIDIEKAKPSISLFSIILLQMGQMFNYLQAKSYKIYSGFIHSDLGISYRMLTYTVFVSGYVTVIHLLASKYYNRIPCNIFIFTCFVLSSLSAFLLYYFYEYKFIIFLSRPLLTFSIFGLWNFVLSMIANFVPIDKQNKRNMRKQSVYMTLWNSSYPISTFCLVVTGVIIHNLSYFDYLLYSAIIAMSIGTVSLFILPSDSIYSLCAENKTAIEKQLKQSLFANLLELCSNNKIFICMMCCAVMDAMLLSMMNLLCGPYLKDYYILNAQQLGIYVTVSIGSAELVPSLIIIPYVATSSRFHLLIVVGALIEFIAIMVWNMFHISAATPPFVASLLLISFVYFGHETLFCGIMFKNQQIAHKSQQVILVALWSIITTITGSIGNIMVGQFYSNYKQTQNHSNNNGLTILLILLALVSASSLCAALTMSYFQYRRKNNCSSTNG